MAKTRKNILFFLPIAALMALLLLRSQVVADAVRQGLSLCAQSLLPALFPFFVAVSWAVNCGLFHTLQSMGIPTSAAVFFLGALGGYPLGRWRKKWLSTPVLLPGEFLGLRSLAGYNT